jgi:type IV secretory pathway VirB10-like protein
MQERSHKIEEGTDESEVTLAAPRFDASEARQAHPVVPLDEMPAGSYAGAGRAPYRVGARRQWPLSLIVVALLAAAALGAVATKVLHRTPSTQTHASDAAAQEAQQPQTDTAPTQANTTPAQANTVPAQINTIPAQTAANAPQADASAQTRTAPAQTAASEEKNAAAAEKSEGSAPGRTREERPVRARRDAESLPPPADAARVERRENDGEDGEQHGHFRGRDGRDEGRDEKDSRRESKHQKKGGARLVDVLVGSSPRP